MWDVLSTGVESELACRKCGADTCDGMCDGSYVSGGVRATQRVVQPGGFINWDGARFFMELGATRWLFRARRRSVYVTPLPADMVTLQVKRVLLYADADRRTPLGYAEREKVAEHRLTEQHKCEGCGAFAGVALGFNRLVGRYVWLCLNCQHLVGKRDFRPSRQPKEG